MNREDFLFVDQDLSSVLGDRLQKAFQEIDAIERNRLLNTPVDDLINYFVERYKIEPPHLLEDQITTAQNETKIDVSQDRNRYISDRSKPFYIPGTVITFYVPFDGEGDLFKYRSSRFSLNPPQAKVSHQELHITYTTSNHNVYSIRENFDRTLAQIKELLTGTYTDVDIFNKGLRQHLEQQIKSRRERLLKDQGIVAALGFPLRQRDDAPTTYAVPVTLKKIIPQMHPTSTQPFRPEPILAMEQYEHILSIISNMVHVMERSPSSFVHMKEENIRQHFLVQLNGQYEGQATGETFNAFGKTDILIRVNDKNIFIAECKFWEGPEAFTKAINQLLGYTSWRDTKIALLLFNRNKKFTEVLTKIPEIIKQHPNFKRQMEYNAETGFRFVLHHDDDKAREIIMTVLAFEIPTG